jgi:hypothetical protein
VGDADGAIVGTAEGEVDGAFDGAFDGVAEGVAVGVCVGNGDGAGVLHVPIKLPSSNVQSRLTQSLSVWQEKAGPH